MKVFVSSVCHRCVVYTYIGSHSFLIPIIICNNNNRGTVNSLSQPVESSHELLPNTHTINMAKRIQGKKKKKFLLLAVVMTASSALIFSLVREEAYAPLASR